MLKKNIQLVDKQNSKPLLPASPDSLTELWKWEEVREVHKGSGMMGGFTRCEQNILSNVLFLNVSSSLSKYFTWFLVSYPMYPGSQEALICY